MYLEFTRMPGESYRRRLRSSLLRSCDVFPALINSFVLILLPFNTQPTHTYTPYIKTAYTRTHAYTHTHTHTHTHHTHTHARTHARTLAHTQEEKEKGAKLHLRPSTE